MGRFVHNHIYVSARWTTVTAPRSLISSLGTTVCLMLCLNNGDDIIIIMEATI